MADKTTGCWEKPRAVQALRSRGSSCDSILGFCPIKSRAARREGALRSHGSESLVDAKIRQRMQRLLGVVDEHDTTGPRLVDDAARLWRRVQRFLKDGLIGADVNAEALELACYALQLPMRERKLLPTGKLGRTSLKDRAEHAAELLVSQLGETASEELLDQSTRILQELPQRTPVLDEAKLLADALNLDDFGATGLFAQAMQMSRTGDGVKQVAEGCEKREQYGYWDARLRDGFHFPPIREIAKRRLEAARAACKLLTDELNEDGTT